ncbi:4507_t:CDS:2, partial [Gigaspora margarita]
VFEKILLTNEFSDLESIKLSQADWVSLENIAAVLKQFAKLSTEMCSSFYPTISAVYPMYNHLMDHAEKRINNTQISEKITMAAQATWDKLKEYYNKTSDSFHYVATILDPRWKLKYFQSWTNNKEDEVYFNIAKDLFNSKFDEYRTIYFPNSTARYSNGYDELNHYLESLLEPSTTDVLEW